MDDGRWMDGSVGRFVEWPSSVVSPTDAAPDAIPAWNGGRVLEEAGEGGCSL